MKNPNKERRWKEKCPDCGKSHYMRVTKCSGCGENTVIMPVSENIMCNSMIYGSSINRFGNCEGCEAYEEHLWSF